MSKRRESLGDSFFGVCAIIAILVILFSGDPDITDGLRAWVNNQAGVVNTECAVVAE